MSPSGSAALAAMNLRASAALHRCASGVTSGSSSMAYAGLYVIVCARRHWWFRNPRNALQIRCRVATLTCRATDRTSPLKDELARLPGLIAEDEGELARLRGENAAAEAELAAAVEGRDRDAQRKARDALASIASEITGGGAA
ncbi:MAG: hypothetical protein ACRDOK_05475 [Streptosporangiaceae bacterium]